MSDLSIMASSVQLPRVFINFRGEELRNGFVSHLVGNLKRNGINVYIDEDETRGKPLSIFFQRIEESKIALAIFSSKYTESNWCLDELVKIKECVDLGKLVVIPVFYKVGTDDVGKLKGVFSDKFWELAKTCKHDGSIDRWRVALKAITKKLGLVLRENSNEGEFVERLVKAVKDVLAEISTNMERETPIKNPGAGDEETTRTEAVPEMTFGIETRLEQLEEKFERLEKKFGCECILTIGVVGMPGIGKRTLTEKFFEKWQKRFNCRAFFGDVRELFKNNNMEQSIIMKKLVQGDDFDQEEVANLPFESLKELLLKSKSLLVLANVSDKKQLKLLHGKCNWMKKGSRILITTSDRWVIEGKVDDTYEVLRLDGKDSLQCFHYHAFGGNICTPEGEFMNLSKKFADYAKGNPFALTALGRELYGKEHALWNKYLPELAKSPHTMIQNLLQIRYDELDLHQKDVFLDIACFFRSRDEYYVRCLVENCDTESIDTVSGINDLASKFLINISGGRIEMHDLLYTFGKELSSKDSRRLCNHKSVVLALRKRKKADHVRGIFLDMSELAEQSFNASTFSEMRKLRYLKFYSSHCHRECGTDCKITFPDGFEFPVDEIRYLYWMAFPLPKLPNDFNPKNLMDLNLPYSKIEEVWEGAKDTPKLKWVDLSHSSKLCNLSGLQNAESLQRLNLEGCTSLRSLPKEMERMKSLIFLNMRGCTSLQVLPDMNLTSMKTLILSNCSSLKEFRVISDSLETLHLDGTAIDQLPKDMWRLQRLIVLNLKDCKMLEAIPDCMGKLKALQELVLSGCSKLWTFPVPIETMKCLQILLLDGTSIDEMPKILQLRGGINEVSSLRRLCLSNNKISNLQIDLCQLRHLKLLDLKYCENLISIPLLPPSLEILDAHGCEKLKTVASPMATLTLVDQVHSKFIFTNCNNLEQVAKNSITSYAQRKSQQDAVRCYKEDNVLEALLITSFPGSEVPSWFNHRTIGSALELDFPPHWCDNRLSTIVVCAVVAFPCTQKKIKRFSIECTCEFTCQFENKPQFENEPQTCTRFSCVLGGGWLEPRKIESDHVFIGYTSSSHITNQLEGSLQSRDHYQCVPTKASIKFEVRDGAGDIVNCGLSLVYEEPKHVVNEEICNGTSSGRYKWLGVVILLVFGFRKVFIR